MSDEGERTCPLCAEEMDLTDQQLKPCKCGYQICVWCWHHILDMAERDDSEGRCPACRSPYDKEKIVGTAANCERLMAESVDRKKSQKSKTKPSEGRRQLSSVRVIQRNLVYIVGLPLDLADEDLLQCREYFGQYGKVLKVSMSRTAAGVIQQFPNNTCSVYITYSKEEEAIRCIQSVHGFVLDGRSLKACFGTTKYCHAWLRNVPCTNSDCLYLHEIGSQEDSFTKDEIISAYTRSRVQQITSGTSSMPRRSGSTLPPPVDYCISNSASAAKPIGKNVSNNTMSKYRSSPPNGSSGGSIALPTAASWAMRASSQSQTTSSICSDGPIKSKLDSVGTLASSFGIESGTQADTLHIDDEYGPTLEGSQTSNFKGKPDLLKPMRHIAGADCPVDAPNKLAINDATAAVNLSGWCLCPPASKYKDTGNNAVPNVLKSVSHARHFTAPGKEGSPATDGKIEKLSLTVDSVSTEFPSIAGTISTPYSDEGMTKLPSQNFDWRTDTQTKAVTSAGSEVEDVITSSGNQRIKDPETVAHTCSLSQSANLLHIPNHSNTHLLHNEAICAMTLNADPPCVVDNRVSDDMLLHSPGTSVISNGHMQNLISSSASPDGNIDHSSLHLDEGELKLMRRLPNNADSSVTPDVGESSIISDILSLKVDTGGDSLSSPQDLVKLLGNNDKQPSSLKLSSSWKVQNNNQSRFSFARQEESRSQAFDNDSSFVVFNLPKNSSFSHDSCENRNSYFDKPALGNSFSSSFDESDIFSSNPLALLPNKLSAVSRAQVSAPPGFSIPNRAPPPGFSSHERMDQAFNNMAGNPFLDSSSLLRNSYQPQTAGTGDIEFMDPAILAVGKGRLEAGLNNSVLDARSHFPQQLSALENEAKRQLLMQRSLLTHQNLRYNDMGDRFSSASDSYGLYSRFVDQSQVSNLNPFGQIQQPRNGLMLNGHWDGWNEVQGENNLGMAELLRNERLGFNRFYTSGYEDSKFRMPDSGDLYNRTFEM